MTTYYNDISLRDRNSFHIDVKAARLIEYDSVEDLRELFADGTLTNWMAVSGGNNILFTKDVESTILTNVSTNISIDSENDESVVIRVDGGAEWDDVVEWCVERGFWGVENLSLIPGKAGAAPIQNIGAYGVEVCDVLRSVEFFDPISLKVNTLEASECKFAYRESIFKQELKGRVVVTSIVMNLSKKATPKLHYADLVARVEQRGEASLRNIREVICEIRDEKLPDTKVMGNAGSFFKNPIVSAEKAKSLRESYPNIPIYPVAGDGNLVKLAAGWLIDQAEMKGYVSGRVGVHDRQALVLVNLGGATGREVVGLAQEVQRRVNELFGVVIDMEVNIL